MHLPRHAPAVAHLYLVRPLNGSPTSAIEAYKAIIDELVARTPSLSARPLTEEGIVSRSPDKAGINALVAALAPEQRTVLGRFLTHERTAGIFDTLALLTWWIDCRDLALHYRGEPVPVQLSGEGLHGDYMGRLEDWQWPDETPET